MSYMLAVLHLALFFTSLVGGVVFLYSTYKMHSEIDPKKRTVTNLVPFIVLFCGSYTSAGKMYYSRALKALFLVLGGVLGLFLLKVTM